MVAWIEGERERRKETKDGSVDCTSDGDRIWSGWARTIYMLRKTRAGAL